MSSPAHEPQSNAREGGGGNSPPIEAAAPSAASRADQASTDPQRPRRAPRHRERAAIPGSRNEVPSGEVPKLIDGRYRVDEALAEGGMGKVYRGWHIILEQPIAIKFMRKEYRAVGEIVSLFLREARACARLKGQNVPHILDIGCTEEGTPFIVSELLEGTDLRMLLDAHRRLPLDYVAELFVHVCDAVDTVHAHGVIHRDLKPENLFLTKPSAMGPEIKLLDFGIAKSVDVSCETIVGRLGIGSPPYMAPEQLTASDTVDQRADVWSLGVVLFEMLTGTLPFHSDTVSGVCSAVLTVDPKAPSQLRAGISEALDAVVLRCLRKDPEERYQTARELREALSLAMPALVLQPGQQAEPETDRDRREVSGRTPGNGSGTLTRSAPQETGSDDSVARNPYTCRGRRRAISLLVAGATVLFAVALPRSGAVQRGAEAIGEAACDASKLLPHSLAPRAVGWTQAQLRCGHASRWQLTIIDVDE